MKKYDEKDGVWRTIGGRRVFIRNGQSLSDAMKESGKFKNSENKYQRLKKQEESFEVSELKEKALATLPKEDIDSHYGDLYLKKTKESETLLSNMKNKDSGLLKTFKDQQTGETWYDIPFANMQDDYKGKSKTGNDYLPKEKKITTQGKSNRKEVSENIQAHILSYYDNPVDFMEQMDAMDYLPTRWRMGEEIAKDGSYLVYNGDMSEFLDNLKINPKGKKFSEDKSFNMYTSLVGRESERLYNRLEKLYEQYKKEHKNSNVTLDDFRKWFK